MPILHRVSLAFVVLFALVGAACGDVPLAFHRAPISTHVTPSEHRTQPPPSRPPGKSAAQLAAERKLWIDTLTWNNVVAWNTAAGAYWPGATGTVSGMVCGGSLPACCTLTIESHGNPVAQNPISSASGLWQDLTSTWGDYGNFHNAKDAPPGTQNARNADIYANGAGWSNWKGDGCYPGG